MSNIISNNNIPIISKDKSKKATCYDILKEALDAPIITNVVNVVKNKPIEPKPIILDSIPIKDNDCIHINHRLTKDNDCIHINHRLTDEQMDIIRDLINNSPTDIINEIERERLKSMHPNGGNNE